MARTERPLTHEEVEEGCRAIDLVASLIDVDAEAVNAVDEDELLTTGEAATFLGVSPRTMIRMRAKGSLIPKVRTLGNHARYTRDQLAEHRKLEIEDEDDNE